LTELAVAMAVFSLVMTAAVLFLSTYLRVSAGVTGTYAAADSVLPVVNTLDRYFRALVVPPAGASTRPLLSSGTAASSPVIAGPYQFAFYANLGDPGGPDLVDAELDGPTPVAGGTVGTFTLTVTAPDPGSCVAASGTWCTYTLSHGYTLARVRNVEAPAGAVFAFLPIDEPPASGSPTTSTTGLGSCAGAVPTVPPSWPPALSSWPPPSGSGVWTSDPDDAWCAWIPTPLDTIWALAVDLSVRSGAADALAAQRQWITYLISPTTAAPA
jgi:hypothetical protein